MKRKKSSSSLSGWLNTAKDTENNVPAVSTTKTKGRSLQRHKSSDGGSKRALHRRPSNNLGDQTYRKGKGPQTTAKASNRSSTDTPWCVKHAPISSAHLAVHKKKVQEVQQWLQFALSKTAKHPILLLTGPSGCGKTATVHALSKELDFSIVEWNDPIDSKPFAYDNSRPLGYEDWELYESQTKKFLNFITRANRYPTLKLVVGGAVGVVNNVQDSRKIVLVEDFPNVFIHDPKKLHTLLRDVHTRLIHPLVFIASEGQHAVGTTSKLFPSSVITNLDIHSIHFNPIARTSTLKTLQRILEAEEDVVKDFDIKGVLERIEESCLGDIRAAINVLQFTCLNESCSTEERGFHDHAQQRDLVGVAGREQPLYLFRALGKILYCKRDSAMEEEILPPHLSHHQRPRLLVNPEEVYESVQLSSDLFIAYLHQNYLDFFGSIEDVEPAIGWLSDSDVIGHVWNDIQDRRQSTADGCRCSLASRGLLFANQSTPSSRWRPLYKPKWTSIMQQNQRNLHAAYEAFSSYSRVWMPVDMVTEILPYMAFINPPIHNQSQISLLHTLTAFQSSRSLSFHKESQLLGETERDDNNNPAITMNFDSHSTERTNENIGMGLLSQETEEIEDFDD